MSDWLRYLFLFVIVVLLQVIIGNNIHLFGVAIPFFYIYFILRLPLSLSVNWVMTLAFVLGLTIDIFSNTPGMNALACVVLAALRKPVLNLYVDSQLRHVALCALCSHAFALFLCSAFLGRVVEPAQHRATHSPGGGKYRLDFSGNFGNGQLNEIGS